MRIIIPTYRRATQQHTYKALPERWQSLVTFVADARDKEWLNAYHPDVPVEVPPETVKTIAQKRAWIFKHWDGTIQKMIMFDDDLRFSARISDAGPELRKATSVDLGLYLDQMVMALDGYAHVGWSARQGNNHMKAGWSHTTRMCYTLGFRLDILNKECELGRIETREDMDYTLQLLRKGYDNCVQADIAVDQHTGFGSAGGCSEERTMERSNADASALAALHPGLVRITEKAYKASIPRIEVVCSWKKALEQGIRNFGRRTV